MLSGNVSTIEELREVIADSSRISARTRVTRNKCRAWLRRSVENDFVKVVTGFRRVGKSYLLKELREYLITTQQVPIENVLFLNFEHDSLARCTTASDLRAVFDMFEAHCVDGAPVYLFLDELQNVQYWEKFVRTLYDSGKDRYKLYVTGSNSSLLSGEFSSALSGRTVELFVHPFDFQEYCAFVEQGVQLDDPRHARLLSEKHMRAYLTQGGLPETINQPPDVVRQYIRSLFQKVLLDDIVKRYSIEKVSVVEKLLHYLMSNIGSTTSFRTIMAVLERGGERVTVPTLQRYAGLYEEAFAIQKVEKFDWKTRNIFSKQHKYYTLDNGLVTYLHASKTNIEMKLLENLVFNTLARTHEQIFYGRDPEGKEIDFIVPLEDGGYRKVQVCMELHEENMRRELGNFVLVDKYLKEGENLLVTLRGKSRTHEVSGHVVREVPLAEFLLGNDS